MNASLVDFFRRIIGLLEQQQIEYMVVGSFASMLYGEPRLTRDLDLVVEISPMNLANFKTAFPVDKFYIPPPEILNQEILNRGQFNIIDLESSFKVDIMIRKVSPHSQIEFQRRQKMSFLEGFSAWVAKPEDIIIKKLVYFREGGSQKHILDIQGILANQAIDQDYLQDWILKLGLQEYWASAIRS